MKNVKKTISLGIIMALLLSLIVIPQNVSAATFPVGENFDTWDSISDGAPGTWLTRASGVSKEGITEGAAGLSENALELTSTAQLLLWIGDAGNKGDTNSYKLSYSFKSNGGRLVSWLMPWRNGDDTNLGLEGTLPLVNAKNGTATLGRQSMDDGMTLGSYTTGNWYNIEAVLDFSSRLCKVYFKDSEGTLIGTRTTAMDSSAYAHRLVLSNWDPNAGSVLIDNISMELTDEKITVLTFEDFENVSGLTDLKKGPFSNYKDQNTWSALEAVVVESTRDGVATKVATIPGPSGSFDWYAGEALKNGTWKISLKLYVNSFDRIITGLGLSTNTCNWNKRQALLDMVKTHNGKGVNEFKLTAFGPAEANRNSVISDIATAEWYDYEAIIDLDNKIAHASLYRDGKKIGGRRNFSLNDSAIANGFDRLGFASWGDSIYCFDDLKIEKLLDYKETAEDYILYAEDFENMETADLAKDGWVFAVPEKGVGRIENGALKLDSVDNTNAEKWITNTNSNSKVKVKYDVMINDDAFILLTDVIGNGSTQNGSWFVDGTPISSYVHESGVYGLATYFHGHLKVSDLPKGKWITIENVFNFKDDLTGNVVTKVKDRDTGMLLAAGTAGNPAEFALKNNNAPDSTSVGTKNFQTLRFRNWSTATPYIDNIVVSEYYDEPSLDDSKVILIDNDGNIARELQNVTPAIEEISLNFGAEMNDESAETNISITDEYGNEVGFSGYVSDDTYVLTLNDILTAKTEYTIRVNKEIETALGVSLGKNFEFSFKTSDSTCIIEKATLYSGTKLLENISGLVEGTKVTVKTTAYNSFDESKPGVILVGCYNGNKLMNVLLEPVAFTAKKKSFVSKDFTLPNMTDVTDINVYIWNTTADMVPYNDALLLSK